MYPSEVFLREKIKASGLAPGDIVRRAGYTNIAKGMRRLKEYLPQCLGGGVLPAALPAILGFEAGELAVKVRETRAIVTARARAAAAGAEAAARAAFRPHLFAVTERQCPEQIVICGLTGGHRRRVIGLSGCFASLSPWRQERVVRGLVRRTVTETGGSLRFFGKIRHFVLIRDYDEPQEAHPVYDLQGKLLPDASPEERAMHNGILEVRLGRASW